MLRSLVAATAVLALAGPALSNILPDAGTVANKFIVHYSIVPDPFHVFSWYTMPRTVAEAQKDNEFSQVAVRDEDKTTVWCRGDDYRVCVLFDQKGSVAGIQMSVKVSELEEAKVKAPVNIGNIPEYKRQTLLGEDVYTATTFFVSKDILLAGGRDITEETLTAPEGIFILQTNKDGVEYNRLHVGIHESEAASAGFTEQACFFGMGKHYFQELTKTSACEAHRPYFLLFGKTNKYKLNGFGYTQYGKVSKGRGWYENPPALAATTIAPNSPPCMSEWINKYGLYTMHVFFVDTPWYTQC